jgi:hypothetical protein
MIGWHALAPAQLPSEMPSPPSHATIACTRGSPW